MRKHYSQMSQNEIQHLINAVRSRSLSIHPHAIRRMQEKRITENQVYASIAYGSIVEAHNDRPGELRVLVRGKVSGAFVCSVVSLTKNEVITCYRNAANDNHKTIDMSAYTWQENLAEV